MNTDNLKVLITGASQGIGKAIAAVFAKEGAQLALHYFDHKEQAELEYPEVTGGKDNIQWFKADFNNVGEVRQLAKMSWDAFGGIDLLINNAGISYKSHFLDFTDDNLDEFMNVNFKGTVALTQEIAKLMIANSVKGAIHTITSVNAIKPSVGLSVYGASKAALETVMKGAALELAPHQIRVNTIALGAVQSPMTEPLLTDDEKLREVNAYIPLGRVVDPIEVALFIKNLVSVDSYMTGATIVYDGGWLLRAGYAKAQPYHSSVRLKKHVS